MSAAESKGKGKATESSIVPADANAPPFTVYRIKYNQKWPNFVETVGYTTTKEHVELCKSFDMEEEPPLEFATVEELLKFKVETINTASQAIKDTQGHVLSMDYIAQYWVSPLARVIDRTGTGPDQEFMSLGLSLAMQIQIAKQKDKDMDEHPKRQRTHVDELPAKFKHTMGGLDLRVDRVRENHSTPVPDEIMREILDKNNGVEEID
ncbi:uncharacterized protein K460DRAFT_432333 [Cucurbitaria berberidis CBS 394.84]|uniref:Uncharacterized protein n=1 Tax=Cucurbitaria berberidis CBS 394.84 TaxID=1168544 RepID=A0A9P4GCL4_9PLEO|nr:uncharacterized protein K460DRAFT_432333 [Cucurbitaria berberidis CBS 394.84]KAF1842876.1 hypothetical protein K460DRAFT_432333 [Cucurbitaria berberidis CBS 394.84]